MELKGERQILHFDIKEVITRAANNNEDLVFTVTPMGIDVTDWRKLKHMFPFSFIRENSDSSCILKEYHGNNIGIGRMPFNLYISPRITGVGDRLGGMYLGDKNLWVPKDTGY